MSSDGEVRDSYDRVADEYTTRMLHELDHKPVDRALLDCFAGMVAGRGPVLEVGCGPGQVARYLHERGAPVAGLDLSPEMIAQARQHHPGIEFEVGSFLQLGARGLAGLVAMYAIVNLASDRLPAAARSFAGALAPGGVALVSFHLGEECKHLDEWWGRAVSIDFHFHPRAAVERALEDAGLAIEVRVERNPHAEVEYPSQRAYLFARKR